MVAFEPQAVLHSLIHTNLLMRGDTCVGAAVDARRAAAGDVDGGHVVVPLLDYAGAGPASFFIPVTWPRGVDFR